MDNIVARELIQIGNNKLMHEYYLSHGSAFDLHQMSTQQNFTVYVSSPRMRRPLTTQGTEFKFIRCK